MRESMFEQPYKLSSGRPGGAPFTQRSALFRRKNKNKNKNKNENKNMLDFFLNAGGEGHFTRYLQGTLGFRYPQGTLEGTLRVPWVGVC